MDYLFIVIIFSFGAVSAYLFMLFRLDDLEANYKERLQTSTHLLALANQKIAVTQLHASSLQRMIMLMDIKKKAANTGINNQGAL